MKINWTYATKFIVSLAGNAIAFLQEYPNITWQQLTAGLIISVLIWLVPNTPKPIALPTTGNSPLNANARAELEMLRAERDNHVN
jgi:hypothetical protein